MIPACISHNMPSLAVPCQTTPRRLKSQYIMCCAVLSYYFRDAATRINEGLSLLENAAYLGLPIPDKLREILAQLHERSKKEAEPTDKGEGDQNA